jgi:hypothetical protein
MAYRAEDRSLGDLLTDLTAEIGALVRQELALARVELGDKATRMGRDAGYLAVGGAVAYAGFLALVAAVILGLGFAIGSVVAAAFIVALIVLGAGYWLVQTGLNRLKHDDVAPRQTLETLKSNVNWAKDQLK